MPDPVSYHSWRGLVFGYSVGASTEYPLTSADGIDDLATSGALLGGGALDGASAGPLRADASSWLTVVDLVGANQAAYIAQRDALKAATWRDDNPLLEEPYDIYLPDEDPVTRFARVTNRKIPHDEPAIVRRNTVAQIEFTSSDSLTYTPLQTSSALSRSDVLSITSEGWAPAMRWTATITGPVVNPQLTSSIDSTAKVRYVGTVASGETLVLAVTPRSRTHHLEGVSIYPDLDGGAGSNRPAQWFPIVAGAQTVTFSGSSGAGTCVFAWREAKP